MFTCSRNSAGDFIAQELAEDQSLIKLRMFGERLRKAHETQALMETRKERKIEEDRVRHAKSVQRRLDTKPTTKKKRNQT